MHNFSNTITSETMQQQQQQQQQQRQRDHSKSNLETSKKWNGHFRGKKRLLSISISISKVFAKFKSQKTTKSQNRSRRTIFVFANRHFVPIGRNPVAAAAAAMKGARTPPIYFSHAHSFTLHRGCQRNTEFF